VLVQRGLKSLNTTKRPGIIALIEAAGLKQGSLDTSSIGFALAPRINAAGRIDDAIIAYNLLLTDDLATARELAAGLSRKNTERQQLLARILEEAHARVLAEDLIQRKLLVLSGEGWSAGVVGLVAGRLCEEFNRPVLVLEQGLEMCKGSARSIPSFNIIEALTDCADLLERFGGHRQAAGFSIKPSHLPALTERLEALAAAKLQEAELQPRLDIDAEISLAHFVEAYQDQRRLEPFGSENPTPLYLTRNLSVRAADPVGADGMHLRIRLYDPQDGSYADGIFFREGLRAAELYLNRKVDIVYSIEVNEWQGQSRLQMRIRDIHSFQ
jgi:single-stranded-DNA-specific exonuclease